MALLAVLLLLAFASAWVRRHELDRAAAARFAVACGLAALPPLFAWLLPEVGQRVMAAGEGRVGWLLALACTVLAAWSAPHCAVALWMTARGASQDGSRG